MNFDVTQDGTAIKILIVPDGTYKDFESVRAEVIRRGKILVIKEINVFLKGDIYNVPDGLDKILSGLSFEKFIDTIQSNSKLETFIERHKLETIEALHQSERLLENAKKTGNWKNVPEAVINEAISKVVITTSMFVANYEIIEEIDIVTYECAYGMDIFVDLFAAIRDFVGGRSKAVEKELRNARIEAMQGLKKEALKLGADGVIAIDLDYSELSSGGKSMLIVIVSGTAVRLREKNI